MPTRLLRDGILTSERVNALSPGAELFYRRLMSVVDDHGRFFADTRLLTSACYPLTFDRTSPTIVRQWLAECSEGHDSLLNVYEVDGKRYLEIKDFRQRTRSDSKFPPPSAGTRPSSADNCPQPADNCGSRARDPEAETSAEAKTKTETETDACAGEPGSPLDPMVATDAERTSSALFEEFVGVFAAAGVAMNDRDIERCLRKFISLEPAVQSLVVADVKRKALNGTWSSERFTPRPWNYLADEQWTRRSIPRLLPDARQESRAERGQREAEAAFLAEDR